mgnify:CR=1 FL=1|jgi:hypothetical protein|tara:strand:+ start:5801 stop:6040 length:240 start_codon:yes stop_codon:yes gene_type:complete
MPELKFLKDHPSRRFKKGDVINMPKESVNAWLISGYAILKDTLEDSELGKEKTSSLIGGEVSKKKLKKQSKFGKRKKKK